MGHNFTVYTDQKSLQQLITFIKKASAKVAWCQGLLFSYDFDIIYRAHELNSNADTISKLEGNSDDDLTLKFIFPDYDFLLNMI